MIFPPERYERIEQLVLQYQGGDKDRAGEELIVLFTPLFNKYIKIIKRGIIDFNDYESRFFLSLFIPDPEVREALKRHYQSKKTREAAYKTLNLINSACLQTFDEDLYQELLYIFFKQVTKYKGQNKTFCAYLASTYHFGVAEAIRKILYNPISTALISDFDEDSIENQLLSKAIEDDVSLDDKLPSNGSDELSNSWVYGLTCSEVFLTLSPFERLILKMFYLDEIGDTGIAEKTGYHRNSIGSKRRAAVEKIRKKTLELGLVKEEISDKD